MVGDAMPYCTTKYFGPVAYEETNVLKFPAGLPGFEDERRFLSLEQAAHAPLVFLQSLTTPDLCFVALPASSIEPSYELEVEDGDLELLGIDRSRRPDFGQVLLKLALVTIAQDGISANLFAPVLINTLNLLAVQAMSPSRRYSHAHPLADIPETVCS
jgi:flagellar assembly factor FliW